MALFVIARVGIIVAVLSLLAMPAQSERAQACSCIPNAAEVSFEQYRVGVVGFVYERSDSQVFFEVERAWGEDVPQRISDSRNQCLNSSVESGRQGLSLVEIDGSWERVGCSQTDADSIAKLAAKYDVEERSVIGLNRSELLPPTSWMDAIYLRYVVVGFAVFVLIATFVIAERNRRTADE